MDNKGILAADLIHKIIEANFIDIYAQPIYSVTDNRFISAEILVRVHDKEGVSVDTETFIRSAEASGLIREIDLHTFERVCQFVTKNEKHLAHMNINFSVKSCESKTVTGKYMSLIEEYGIPKDFFIFELTETAKISKRKKLLDNIFALRKFGANLSLDDFGTGSSNLNYMIDMPVSFIKFDFKMTNEAVRNKKARVILSFLVCMAHALKFEVVAEGVEDDVTYHIMKDMGVDFIQGFYFAHPMPLDELPHFLGEQQDTGAATG